MSWRRIKYPVLGAVLFGLYFGSAVFGLKVNAVSGFATLVWIPSGLALAFLFKFGLRYWPAVMLAAFAANYANNAPLLAAAGIGIGNTLEPLIGAFVLRRFIKLDPSLNHVNHVLGLIFFAGLFSPVISATVGVTTLWLNDVIEFSGYDATWIAWWAGDAISVLVVASLLLVWGSSPILFRQDWHNLFEIPIFLMALLATIYFVFGTDGFYFFVDQPKGYLIFPFLVYAAIRYGQRMITISLLLISSLAIWYTTHGFGLSASDNLSDSLLNLQVYMVVVAGTSLILGAAISEQKLQARKKDEFISVASHELRTPLTSIKVFTQTLQTIFEKKGDRESYAHMSRVNRQIERLNRLVIKLLDLSRIQEGRVTLQKEKFTVGSLIREIATEVAETTHHKIVIQGRTHLTIFADRDRIGRVLTNLMSNAASYSPKADQIIIKVSKRPTELLISVHDFGVGIAKQDQPHIFDRYFQAQNNTTGKSVSLGLGLFIAKSIIERHGGKIWVRSSSNQKKYPGSTFSFTLPLKPAKK